MKALPILAILLLAACTPESELKADTLQAAVQSVNTLDEKYGGAWRLEHIPNYQADAEKIDAHIAEVKKLVVAANQSGNADAYQFMVARWLMLDTEKSYLKAQEFDPRPIAEITFNGTAQIVNASLDEFDCSNAAKIKRATELYADIILKGQTVISLFDSVLQRSPEAQELIGVKVAGLDKRPRYYTSQLGKVVNTVKINTLLLERMCKVPVGNLYKPSAPEY